MLPETLALSPTSDFNSIMSRVMIAFTVLLAAASAYLAPRAVPLASVTRTDSRRAQPVMRISKSDMKRRIKVNEAVWHATTQQELLSDKMATLLVTSNPKVSRKMLHKVRTKAAALGVEVPAGFGKAEKRS